MNQREEATTILAAAKLLRVSLPRTTHQIECNRISDKLTELYHTKYAPPILVVEEVSRKRRRKESAPPQTEALGPQTVDLVPETAGLAPETAGLVPETAGLVPETVGLAPETPALVPETEALLPQTEALAPETPLFVPQRIPEPLPIVQNVIPTCVRPARAPDVVTITRISAPSLAPTAPRATQLSRELVIAKRCVERINYKWLAKSMEAALQKHVDPRTVVSAMVETRKRILPEGKITKGSDGFPSNIVLNIDEALFKQSHPTTRTDEICYHCTYLTRDGWMCTPAIGAWSIVLCAGCCFCFQMLICFEKSTTRSMTTLLNALNSATPCDAPASFENAMGKLVASTYHQVFGLAWDG